MTIQPLILLPGLLCDDRLWAHQSRGLTDLAGPIVPDLTRHDTVSDLARDVLAAAPERFALAGLSMGGMSHRKSSVKHPNGSLGWPCSTHLRAPTAPSNPSGGAG